MKKNDKFGENKRKTRPDTRPIPVADGWAGLEMRVFTLFDSCSRTDGRTDKGSYRVACPQLKMKKKEKKKKMETGKPSLANSVLLFALRFAQ